MKILTGFSLRHNLAFMSQAFVGTLLSIPVIAPANAEETTRRFELPARQIAPPGSSAKLSIPPTSSSTVPMPTILSSIDLNLRNKVIYIGPDYFDKKNVEFSSSIIKKNVFNENKIYLMDLISINKHPDNKEIKRLLRHAIGIEFDSDFLVIGQYKGELIYTQLEKNDYKRLQSAILQNMLQIGARRNTESATVTTNEIPHMSFYLDVIKEISDAECTFPTSHITRPQFRPPQKELCEGANISLKYRVNLMRSISGNSIGSAVPDKKIVRITLDDDSAGTGITLNTTIRPFTQKLPQLTPAEGHKSFTDNWRAAYVTSAIAKDYKFTVSAESLMPDGTWKTTNKATILKTVPASNVDPEVEIRATSGLEIGVSAGLEADGSGPKAKTEAKATFTQSRTIVYKTQDYRIERYSPNPSTATFTWNRQHNSTADLLLSKKTNDIWNDSHPFNLSVINPIGYQGFVPNFDIVFVADADATGISKIKVDSSVNLWPIRAASFDHGPWLSFQMQHHWQQTRRITKSRDFKVDWDLPVFTGGRPVNLRLGGYNSKCIGHGENAKVELDTCDIDSVSQSFIYDRLGRYVSAKDTTKCLDIGNLSQFQECNSNLSQQWSWSEKSDLLQNQWIGNYLAHDINENQLVSASEQSEHIKLRTLTDFTNIYEIKHLP